MSFRTERSVAKNLLLVAVVPRCDLPIRRGGCLPSTAGSRWARIRPRIALWMAKEAVALTFRPKLS